jgi:hypothetical protein
MKDNFVICIESLHLPDNGEQYNVSSIHAYMPLTLCPKGSETSQIFLRDTHQTNLALRNTEDATGGKPIAG